MKSKCTAVLLALVLLGGCAARHPGSANQFDSSSYDTLIVAHSVIETTKADLAANKFPPQNVGNVKTALNNLIQTYNVADTAYQSYHSAAVAGTATTAQQASLTTALANVTAATTTLNSAKVAQ